MEIRRNGKVSGNGTFTPANVDGTMPAGIGGKPNGSFPLQRDVQAVLAWKGALAADALTAVETALMTGLHHVSH